MTTTAVDNEAFPVSALSQPSTFAKNSSKAIVKNSKKNQKPTTKKKVKQTAMKKVMKKVR